MHRRDVVDADHLLDRGIAGLGKFAGSENAGGDDDEVDATAAVMGVSQRLLHVGGPLDVGARRGSAVGKDGRAVALQQLDDAGADAITATEDDSDATTQMLGVRRRAGQRGNACGGQLEQLVGDEQVDRRRHLHVVLGAFDDVDADVG